MSQQGDTRLCSKCSYDLKDIAIIDGTSTCPECGTVQDVASRCERCRYTLAGIEIKDARAICPECGYVNVMNVMRLRREESLVRRRRWLIRSPWLALLVILVSFEAPSSKWFFSWVWWAMLGWCFVAPVVYGAVEAMRLHGRQERVEPAVDVAIRWLTTSIVASLAGAVLVFYLAWTRQV
jgi:predicted RNA-binding Zn-ribbon protein involved in translation (DUF1610 family)